jgi:hypothetical protein
LKDYSSRGEICNVSIITKTIDTVPGRSLSEKKTDISYSISRVRKEYIELLQVLSFILKLSPLLEDLHFLLIE